MLESMFVLLDDRTMFRACSRHDDLEEQLVEILNLEGPVLCLPPLAYTWSIILCIHKF